MRAYALALIGAAAFAPSALASGTCLVEVDGQPYLDGPCDVHTGHRVIFFDRHGGDHLTVAVVQDEATPDRGEAERSDQAGWRDRLGPVRRDGCVAVLRGNSQGFALFRSRAVRD